MSTLKQLRLRISGIKSTQKITRAMKMVAASKLLKVQEVKENAQPYANKLHDVVTQLSNSILGGDASPLLVGNGKSDTHLLVAVSSDRGLCGALNTNISKMVKKQIQTLKAENKSYKILCVGKRAFEQLKSLYSDSIIETLPCGDKVSYEEAKHLSLKITSLFEHGEFDICTFVYTAFQNALKQNVNTFRLIPLQDELEESHNNIAHNNNVYEYEPKESEMLDYILPLNLAVQIYYILLESIASEHGARMTSMDSATNNAKDMIADLSLLYNRSRQASITKELIEIISGAEAI
jgi:F-type H+-transporting ATPase subunit gamma